MRLKRNERFNFIRKGIRIVEIIGSFIMGVKIVWSKLYNHVCPIQYARSLGVNIDDTVKFSGRVHWGTEPYLISIGANTGLSHNITFLTHDGGVTYASRLDKKYRKIIKFGRIDVGENCFVGTGVTILPDVIIGNNCIIGANSLVTKDIPSGEVWGGNPARKICTTIEYAEKCLRETPEYYTRDLLKNKRDEAIKIADARRNIRNAKHINQEICSD